MGGAPRACGPRRGPIRVAPPSPRMVERDPYAVRFGVALLAFAAAVAAGPEMYGRLAAAFDWRSDEALAAAAASRIDAWIDPPPYAGRPPVVIEATGRDRFDGGVHECAHRASPEVRNAPRGGTAIHRTWFRRGAAWQSLSANDGKRGARHAGGPSGRQAAGISTPRRFTGLGFRRPASTGSCVPNRATPF